MSHDDNHCVLYRFHVLETRGHPKLAFGKPFFIEVVFVAAWNIWIIRNDLTFRGERASFASRRCKFVHEITLLAHRIKSMHRDSLLMWTSNLP